MSKIAVFGLNGALGGPTLEALTSAPFAGKVAFPIKAITRTPQESTDKVQYIKGDLTSDEGVSALIEQLKDVDVIIELLNGNPTLDSAMEKIVGTVKPKLFIPSQFGTDLKATEKVFPGFLSSKEIHSANARKSGVKTVDVITSLFFTKGSFLDTLVQHAGIDPEEKTVTYYGPENTQFSFSNTDDIGKAIAAIATLENKDVLPDVLHIHSGKITYKDVVKRWEAINGVTLKSKSYTWEETQKLAKDTWATGFDPSKFLLYLNLLIGIGEGLKFDQVDNELINPSESLFKWSSFN